MNRKLLLGTIVLTFISSVALADCFVPEFNKMQTIRCDFEESIYNQDHSLVTTNKQFRIYRLDDENSKIYLQKEPIDNILNYDNSKIEFNLQSMTDDSIMMSHTVIDRETSQYHSSSTINYDNPIFGNRYSKSEGTCKPLN